MDPAKRAYLAARDAESKQPSTSHGVRCRTCTLLVEHCKCGSKFPRLRARTNFEMLVPRAPATAYSLFFDAASAGVRRELGEAGTSGAGSTPTSRAKDVAALLSERWMKLDPAEKAKFNALADADERRFRRERDLALRNAAQIQHERRAVLLSSGKTVRINNTSNNYNRNGGGGGGGGGGGAVAVVLVVEVLSGMSRTLCCRRPRHHQQREPTMACHLRRLLRRHLAPKCASSTPTTTRCTAASRHRD